MRTQRLFIKLSLVIIFAGTISGCVPNTPSVSLETQKTHKSKSKNSKFKARVSTNFTSKAAGFSIYFPGKPIEKHTLKSQNSACYKGFTYVAKTKQVVYAIDVMAIPPGARKGGSPTVTFDNLQRKYVRRSQGKLKMSRDLTLQGHLGREFMIYMPTKGRPDYVCTQMCIYLTPKFGYQLVAVGSTEAFQTQRLQIEKYFDSFQIL